MNADLEKLSLQWQQLVAKAKGEEYIDYTGLLPLYQATYQAFTRLKKRQAVPRTACRILMGMDEFTYYAASLDENYLGELCPGLYYLNYALKTVFFRGDYRSEFFLGKPPERVQRFVLDVEKLTPQAFILFLKGAPGDYDELVLTSDAESRDPLCNRQI